MFQRSRHHTVLKGYLASLLTAPSLLLFPSFPLQLFSIVIFGCIANEGYINRPNEVEEYCIFNRNQNACNYGVFMGSMTFLCCIAFLALDVYFPQISSVKDRKKAVVADIGLSGKLDLCTSHFCYDSTIKTQQSKTNDQLKITSLYNYSLGCIISKFKPSSALKDQ